MGCALGIFFLWNAYDENFVYVSFKLIKILETSAHNKIRINAF